MAEPLMKACAECKRLFHPSNSKAKLCKECAAFRKPHMNKKKARHKKDFPSIYQVSHVERVYNTVNGTFKHYGEIVSIIDRTPADRCVCCGDVIPEGRMVCPACEQKGKRWWE